MIESWAQHDMNVLALMSFALAATSLMDRVCS